MSFVFRRVHGFSSEAMVLQGDEKHTNEMPSTRGMDAWEAWNRGSGVGTTRDGRETHHHERRREPVERTRKHGTETKEDGTERKARDGSSEWTWTKGQGG